MKTIAIIGAGIGGLTAALRLAHAGHAVDVFERHDGPGGKMRTVASAAGPIDAGPTVLTLRGVFEALFADVGERLDDHVTLIAEDTLARHYWRDGTQLDLMADAAASVRNVTQAFGKGAGQEFKSFSDRAARLFRAFDAPMMKAEAPSTAGLVARVMKQPLLALDMAPGRSLEATLARTFSEPKLRQLFGRYATYVGGRPDEAPALLSLIWAAEAAGVWRVKGGMHQLAGAIEALAQTRGVRFHYGADVSEIKLIDGAARGVTLNGETHAADQVLFNGDPRALGNGLLGSRLKPAVEPTALDPRSLSAAVLTFAGRPSGPELSHHTVFFNDDPADEFAPLAEGRIPTDPTLYVCAQGADRFEIIMNAPPTSLGATEAEPCLKTMLTALTRAGLTFHPTPTLANLTTPEMFETMFPASAGSLYGRSPKGMTSGLKRPRAQTAIPGLFLAGGGAHPGAGVPMAALSGQHAAAAMLRALPSTSMSTQTATRGGTLTA